MRNTGTDGNWDYIGGIVYHNGAIEFIQTEEGRAKPNGGTYAYQYDLKDHLGNSRASFYSNNGAASILQEDEYYAFGLRQGVYDAANNNRYLYNGKEVQTDLADQYDYGARFYDPVIARFSTPDPLSEKHSNITLFSYSLNNPINFVDKMGLDTASVKNITHNTTAIDYGNGNIVQLPAAAEISSTKLVKEASSQEIGEVGNVSATVTTVALGNKVIDNSSPYFTKTSQASIGEVTGKAGKVATVNMTFSNEGYSKDVSIGPFGVSADMNGLSTTGVSLSYSSGTNSMSIGIGENGISFSTSNNTRGHVTGQTTTYAPNL